MSFIPRYNNFQHGFNLIIPKDFHPRVGQAVELVKTILPLLGLDESGAKSIVVGVPGFNIGVTIFASVMERSLAGRKWDLGRNSAEFAGSCLDISFGLFLHTIFNIGELGVNQPKTLLQKPLTQENIDYSLKTMGNSFYLVLLMTKNEKLRIGTLLVQAVYQAFQLRSQGVKFLQQEKGMNYQTLQLGLDIGVKATMTIVRLVQALQVWRELANQQPRGKNEDWN